MKDKRLALFDIDDTLYKGPSTFHFSNFLSDHKIISQESANIIQSGIGKFLRGEVNYTTTVTNLLSNFAASLKEQPEKSINNLAKSFFNENVDKFNSFTTSLFKLLSETHDIYLVTSAPSFIAKSVMSCFSYYVKNAYSTTYETINGKFTGNILNQIDKEKVTLGLIDIYGMPASLAFGDSIEDIKMFNHVQNPVCFNPKDDLKDYAIRKSWKIVTSENILTTVRELIGS